MVVELDYTMGVEVDDKTGKNMVLLRAGLKDTDSMIAS